MNNNVPSSLGEFSRWVYENRIHRNLTLKQLATLLNNQGYPISHNKLWRIENINESKLKKVDLELKSRLEILFDSVFGEATSINALINEIVSMIDKWKSDVHLEPPRDINLRKIYDALTR